MTHEEVMDDNFVEGQLKYIAIPKLPDISSIRLLMDIIIFWDFTVCGRFTRKYSNFYKTFFLSAYEHEK